MLTVWLPLPNYRLQFGGAETGVKTDTTGSYSLELPGFGVKSYMKGLNRGGPAGFGKHFRNTGFRLDLIWNWSYSSLCLYCDLSNLAEGIMITSP